MHSDDLSSPANRSRAGKLAGATGIVCNTLLSGAKIWVGQLCGASAIVADGLNNLSDMASSLVTLLAFQFSEKPADRHHPYGHARFEYLASLTVSMLIVFLGLEQAKSSIEKLLHPASILWSPVAIWVLTGSVLVKLGLMGMNRFLGKKLDSKVLLATAADSRNDALTSLVVILATAAEHRTGLHLDGAMSLLVSLFILFCGFSLAKQTVSALLGEAADPALTQQLTDYIQSQPMVIGCHDLMVHDYGPGRRYASLHVEMDRQTDPLVCHGAIDAMERSCLRKFGVHLVIHYDPVANDPQTLHLKKLVRTILQVRDPQLELHDFRVQMQENTTHLIFDLVVPEEARGQTQQLEQALTQALQALEPGDYCLDITYDL